MKIKFITVLTIAFALFLSACGKSDADLQKAVTEKLAAASVTGVTVAVKDGVATLTGEVADAAAKKKAEETAKSVEGIKSVVNSTTLKPVPAATPAAPDAALTGKANENLKKAGCGTASVTVVDGKATLTGEAPSDKFAECVRIVNEAGITGIDNQLKKGK